MKTYEQRKEEALTEIFNNDLMNILNIEEEQVDESLRKESIMPKKETVVVKYEARLSKSCRDAIKIKADSEYRPQNTVIREILEKWAEAQN